MIDASDPHYTDRITQMGMTLNGICEVGRLTGRRYTIRLGFAGLKK